MSGYDIVLRNLRVYDGTGAPPFQADIAIQGGRIAAIGSCNGSAGQELDLSGLALAPGFIDVHTHDDFAAVIYPDMAFKLLGGVTTCIVGNCGFGAAPFTEAAILAKGFHPRAKLPEWHGYQGYLDYLDQHPPALNIAALIGHGTARMAAMKRDNRPPDGAELVMMKGIVREGLDAGALGFSTGLVYEPGSYAATQEIIELASEMRGTSGVYTTHMRDEGTELLASIDEAVAIGREAGVSVQISHHKASGQAAWGLVRQSLRRLELAQGQGLDIHADQYPYTAGSTILSGIIHQGAFDDAQPSARQTPPDCVVIASCDQCQEWEGQSIADLMQQFNLTAADAAHMVLEAEPGTTVVLHTMSEDDVRMVMQHPTTMIGSDGIPTLDGKPHPRLYNSFARVLGHYARDLQLMSMQEAVYKMTGFAARKFGMADRGEIRENAIADLVVFDEARILDQGTFLEPNRYPIGIHSVYVGGQLAANQGQMTQARAGQTIRRID